MKLLDLAQFAEIDDGTVTNAQLGAALRLLAHEDLATTRPRRIVLLGSRYMADNLEALAPAGALLEWSRPSDEDVRQALYLAEG